MTKNASDFATLFWPSPIIAKEAQIEKCRHALLRITTIYSMLKKYA